MKGQTIVQLLNIQKSFYPSGVKALKEANLSLRSGSIHVLLGANGAGKTTLVRIIAGELQPDNGQIFVDGKLVHFKTPKDAMRHGIVLVHQNLSLVDELSVLENLFLGREPRTLFFVSKRKARAKINELAERLSLPSLDGLVANLSMAEKQKVEIARALMLNARVLLLDEPTAYLGESEEEKLFELLSILKKYGCAVLFITHDVNQALRVADEVTVLREGRTVLSEETSRLSVERVVEAMGFDPSKEFARASFTLGEELLKVSDLTIKQGRKFVLDRVSLTLRKGEVVGLYGPGNDGQFDLLEAIVGVKRQTSGKIFFEAQDISHLSIRNRRKLGIAYVPKDRLKEAVNLEGSVLDNTVVNVYREEPYAKFGLLRRDLLERYALAVLKDFDIKVGSIAQPVGTLSGGNLQRLILARELFDRPKLLLACKPIAGLDVQVQHYIVEKLQRLKSWGCALIATNNAEEAFTLCDRVLVLSKGKLKRSLQREQLSKPSTLVAAVGD